jgi:DNA polymerase-3 subunit delta
MKISNLRAFEKHIEGAAPAHFSRLYTIICKDPYLRKTASTKLVDALLAQQQNRSLGLQLLDGDLLTKEALGNELGSMSFFCKDSVVLIENADKLRKPCTEFLEGYFAKPNPAITLVLSATQINGNTNLYKKSEKAGIILDIPEEKPWEKEKIVAEWIRERFASAKKNASHPTAQYMVKLLGTELSLLHQEIEKIICYVGERQEITIPDISITCASVNVETAWQLGESIFKGDVSAALRISKALLNDGVPFFSLLKQIRHQFETDFQVCGILSNGGSGAEIAQRFPYMKGMVLDRHIQMAQNYGLKKFRNGLIKIDETEVQAKNSSLDTDLMMEMLLIKLM